MISFVNAQGSVKIRLACSKALLLTISSSNIITHSNGYIKGDKYFFFYKSILFKLNYLQSRVETPYRKMGSVIPELQKRVTKPSYAL